MWLTFHFRTISGRCIYFFLSTLCILRRAFVRKTWHYLCLKEYGQSHRQVKTFQNVSL
ncbi:hypothetical protein HMPREF0208_00993 [Citrobacter koseri]|nr:hypothetical protein HMPREF0208_00993 [Citrobacter koseri]